MMKFFRKYNKQLLAVFMVLLMIVFLGGSALDSFFRPTGNRVIAYSALGPISQSDQAQVDTTETVLRGMGVNWEMPVPGMVEPLTKTDWILLTREAKKFGLSMPSGPAVDRAGLHDLSVRLRIKPQNILAATGDFAAIRETALTVAAASAPSEAEVLAATRRAVEKVKIQAVVLPASAFADPEAEFSEEQIQAHFRTYREREAGTGLSFGYFVPEKVKVQYIKIDRDKLAEVARVADLDKKARAFYDANRDKHYAFKRPPKPKPEGEAPAEGPPEPDSPYLSWEEAREKAIELVKKKEAAETKERIANWLVQYTAEPWLDAERGPDRYKIAPAEVARLEYYDAVIAKIPETMAYPAAVSVGTTDFFSQTEATDIPGIGRAFFQPERGGETESLRDTAFRSQAVVPEVPTQEGTNPASYLSLFQTCRYPLNGPDGSLYLFRVIEGRAAHMPEHVDEVRNKVIADLKTLKAYETAKAKGEAIVGCEPSLSLADAYHQDEELVERLAKATATAGLVDPPPIARSTGHETGGDITSQQVYVGAGVGSLPLSSVEGCFALENESRKLRLFEIKERALVMVVEWIESQRGNTAEYDEMRKKLLPQMTQSRSRAVIAEWLKPANIRARNQWRLATE